MKEIILYLFLLIWSLICFYFEFSSLGYWSILLYATLLIYDILIIYNFSKIKNSRLFVNIKKKDYTYVGLLILLIFGLFAPLFIMNLIIAISNVACVSLVIAINLKQH